jgi:hypothetical protein
MYGVYRAEQAAQGRRSVPGASIFGLIRFDSSQTHSQLIPIPAANIAPTPIVNRCPLLPARTSPFFLPSFFLRVGHAVPDFHAQLQPQPGSRSSTHQTKPASPLRLSQPTPAQPLPPDYGPLPNKHRLLRSRSGYINAPTGRPPSSQPSATIAIHPTPACKVPLFVEGNETSSDLVPVPAEGQEEHPPADVCAGYGGSPLAHPCPHARAG